MTMLKGFTQPIERIHVYLMEVEALRAFSFGTWRNRQHVFICLESNAHQGWGENIVSVNNPDVPIDSWLAVLAQLKGRSLEDALAMVRLNLGLWRDRLTEAIEMALFDLAGKLGGISALQLLRLHKTNPVAGAWVILSDDLAVVGSSIRHAIETRQAEVVKVKLFGDLDLDQSIIKLVRRYAPKENTFLLGDVNCGYCPKEFDVTIEEVEQAMHTLASVGLDACEDPGRLTIEGWVALQAKCPELAIIPDYPLRPARLANKTLCKGMGRFYNIHPGSMASIIDAIELAGKVQSFGAGLMIGDDSLIGPGCTIWQQIAIGLGASWVEAVEKENDSDQYKEAIQSSATKQSGSFIELKPNNHGFGLILDLNMMEEIASKSITI